MSDLEKMAGLAKTLRENAGKYSPHKDEEYKRNCDGRGSSYHKQQAFMPKKTGGK